QTITWEIEVPTPVGLEGNYSYTTNLTDASCVPYFGGYLDLRTVIDAQPTPGVVGDVGVFNYLTSTPFNFFGEQQLGLGVTPHGFVLQGGTYDGTPWVAQSLPNPAAPNGLIAPFWADTEIVRVEGDPGAERGVTVASDPTAAIVEFDNLQMFGEPTQVLGDVQLQVLVETDPNGPDAWIVFGEPGFIPSDFSIGIEDLEGDRGLSIGDSIEDLWQAGNVICLDYEGPTFEPVVLSYDVTVDNDADLGVYTNQAEHTTDDPYAVTETASYDVEVIETPDAPVNLTPPTIEGDPVVGNTLTVVDDGEWDGVGLTFTYQWLADGEPIAGATESTYTLVADDVDAMVSVEVTATDIADQSATAESNEVGPVTLPPAPANVVP